MEAKREKVKIVFNENCVIVLDRKEEWSIIEEAVLNYSKRFKNDGSEMSEEVNKVKDKILML